MPPWVRRVFIHKLPKLLFMRVPAQSASSSNLNVADNAANILEVSTRFTIRILS